MPGLFTRTFRPTGTILTEDIYNGDLQDIIDHLEPSYMDDLSPSVGAMQSTLDPGESGTEAQASTLEQEVKQLRHMLLEMKGTLQWYITQITRSQGTTGPVASAIAVATFPPTGTTTYYAFYTLTTNYVAGGNLSWRITRRSTGGSGTAVMTYSAQRERHNTAVLALATGTAANFAPGDGNSRIDTLTIPGTNLAPGDRIVMSLTRDGNAGADDDGGNILWLGSDMEFTGFAGRP